MNEADDKRKSREAPRLRRDRLAAFDEATARQRVRERSASLPAAKSRGWTRAELYNSSRHFRKGVMR